MCPDISDNLSEDISVLLTAISQKNYPLIYKELRRFTRTFSPGDANTLLRAALAGELRLKAFRAILDNSPPVKELFSPDFIPDKKNNIPFGLLEMASGEGRADVLSLLIERGAGPNRTDSSPYSPLEAALRGYAAKSVEILVRQTELDTTWTEYLLREWALPGPLTPRRRACCRAMAPRFLGRKLRSRQPLPIPEPMTAMIIAEAENWPMLERFCRERAPISLKEGRKSLKIISRNKPPRELSLCFDSSHVPGAAGRNKPGSKAQTECAAALAALLDSCPGLLKRESECRELLRCFLWFAEEAQACLRPWAESLGSRRIAMAASDWGFYGHDMFPDLWHRLLPRGPILVLDRWSDTFDIDGFWGGKVLQDPAMFGKTLSHVLAVCPVRGKGKEGKLSPLAQTVLRFGGVRLIDSLFRQSDGLLATEDPGALADFVLKENLPRATRAAVLSLVHKDMDYDL